MSTNLVNSPLALALFALLGAGVALGVRRRGWIDAPVAFYVGLVLLAFTRTLTDGAVRDRSLPPATALAVAQ